MSTTTRLICGDALEELKKMDNESIDCCITSPPYWGLRDYGIEGQLGLEKTPEEYVAKIVEVFGEVKRILKKEGTCWLNLGDTYSAWKDCKSVPDSLRVGGKSENANVIAKGQSHSRNSKMLKQQGYKNKDLIGIPWRVAFALQSEGWYLRQDIIWHKPNPMPESVTDRCTKSHEYIFLLAKSQKYYFDNEVIKELTTTNEDRPFGVVRDRIYNYDSKQKRLRNRTRKTGEGQDTDIGRKGCCGDNGFRNKRSVWTVTTKPFKGAHFAIFPEDLITPCVLAGCPKEGTILDPFSGAGTTGVVAKKNNRNFIGIELNPKYVEMAQKRIDNTMESLF